jgi:GWxTD domain-containing protein
MLDTLLESAVRALGISVAVWIVLRLLRIRSPQSLSMIWTAVLFSALAMPLLMPAMEVVMRSAPEAAVAWIPVAPHLPISLRPPSSESVASAALHLDASALIAIAYVVVASLALFRLTVGVVRGQRLRRKALRLDQAWASGWDIRVSDSLAAPVTYGRTILLPSDWSDWDVFKRDVILEHEKSHVRRRDFFVQLLAGVHRAVFWFSPLAWWLHNELLRISEDACDDEALRTMEDRVNYAEILVDLARAGSKYGFVGVAMARGKTVERRIERILRETKIAPRISLVGQVCLVGALLPLVCIAAGSWTQGVPRTVAAPGLEQQVQPAPVRVDAGLSVWIEEEVPDISAKEEQDAFKNLRSDEEREKFIMQFWLRRDPTPGTAGNEYRDEYYRRIRLANERFTATMPGWKTDRGRILIRFGEPNDAQIQPAGTNGRTSPFEVWRYRSIEGVGQNVTLEFVDAGGNGEYRLTAAILRNRLLGSNP